MKALRLVATFAVGFAVGLVLWWLAGSAPAAYADYGNPWGHRAGGRFDYYRYDDAMEILTDTETGQEYLVWYYRDEIEIQPLGTVVDR